MRALPCLLLVTASGCSYPDFEFTAPSDAALETSTVDSNADSTRVEDSFGADTFVADAVTPDSMMQDSLVEDAGTGDTFAPDTFVPDTFAPDTFAPDTFAPDTFVADTFVPDTFVPTGCTGSTAKFCADWDKSTAADQNFNFFAVTPAAMISVDTAGGRSAPNAFLARTAPEAGGSVSVANVSKLFSVATTDTVVRIDAYIKLESATFPSTLGGSAFLLKLQRDSGGGDGVTFSMNDGFFVDRIGVTYEYYPLAPKPKVGVWTHVRMHTKMHTTAGSVTVWIDDMSTPVLSKSGISTVKMDSTAHQFVTGLYAQDASGPFAVRYDDVTVSY